MINNNFEKTQKEIQKLAGACKNPSGSEERKTKIIDKLNSLILQIEEIKKELEKELFLF